MLLDAVIEEAKRRGCHRIFLWTHERQNERAHRLYGSRRFVRTGRTMHDDEGNRSVNGVAITNGREVKHSSCAVRESTRFSGGFPCHDG